MLLWWRNLKEPFLWTIKCPELGLFGFRKKWRVSRERASGEHALCSLAKEKFRICYSPLARERKIQNLLLATRSRSRFFDFFRTLGNIVSEKVEPTLVRAQWLCTWNRILRRTNWDVRILIIWHSRKRLHDAFEIISTRSARKLSSRDDK